MISEDDVIISEKKFSKSAKTSYRVLYDPTEKKETYEYYNVGAVLFLLENKELKYSNYARKATAEKVQVVEFPDKKDLLAYLKGEIPMPNAIDKLANFEIPIISRNPEVQPEKRRYVEDVETTVKHTTRPILKKPAVKGPEIIFRGETATASASTSRSPTSPNMEVAAMELSTTAETINRYDKRIQNPSPSSSSNHHKQGARKDNSTSSPIGEKSPKKRPREANFLFVARKFNPKSYWKLIPIIIIPSGAPSLITIFNAQDILQNLTFVKSEDKVAQGRVRNSLLVRDKHDGRVPELYHLVDNASKLEKDDWPRVVGIFVAGRTWQFKKWPYTMEQIFSKFPLFYIKYADEPIDCKVKSWPLKVIDISKTDKLINCVAIAKLFWKFMDQILSA